MLLSDANRLYLRLYPSLIDPITITGKDGVSPALSPLTDDSAANAPLCRLTSSVSLRSSARMRSASSSSPCMTAYSSNKSSRLIASIVSSLCGIAISGHLSHTVRDLPSAAGIHPWTTPTVLLFGQSAELFIFFRRDNFVAPFTKSLCRPFRRFLQCLSRFTFLSRCHPITPYQVCELCQQDQPPTRHHERFESHLLECSAPLPLPARFSTAIARSCQ